MAGAAKLYGLAQDVLTAVQNAFADEAIGLPSRQYVANGEVAHDCEQLSVGVLRGFVGTPEIEPGGAVSCASTLAFDLEVRLLRCVPGVGDSGNPPSAAEIQASASEILADGYVLFRGLLRAINADEFGSSCRSIGLTGLEPLGPEGLFGGWQATLTAVLL